MSEETKAERTNEAEMDHMFAGAIITNIHKQGKYLFADVVSSNGEVLLKSTNFEFCVKRIKDAAKNW